MGSLDQLQLMAALAEQIYHRNEDDFPITLDDLGVQSAGLITQPVGLQPDTTADNGTAYYSPRGFVGEVVSAGNTRYVVFRGTDASGTFLSGFLAAFGNGEDQLAAQSNGNDLGDFAKAHRRA